MDPTLVVLLTLAVALAPAALAAETSLAPPTADGAPRDCAGEACDAINAVCEKLFHVSCVG